MPTFGNIGLSLPGSGSEITASFNVLPIYFPSPSYSRDASTIGTLEAVINNYDSTGSYGELFFRIPSSESRSTTGSKILTLFATGSNDEPRVGIGFSDDDKPIKAFDVKSKSDTAEGTEFLIRSSRLTEGAQVGDLGGSIRFVIDSASFGTVTSSGSVAEIDSIVTDVAPEGVRGDLSIKVGVQKEGDPTEIIRFRNNEGAPLATLTGSLITSGYIRSLDEIIVGDTTIGGAGVNATSLTASIVSASGDITASSLTLDNSFQYNNVILESTESSISAGNTTLGEFPTASYKAIHIDYLITSGSSKARAGHLISTWKGTDITFTDTSAESIGNTSDAEFSVVINGANADLKLSSSDSYDVTISSRGTLDGTSFALGGGNISVDPFPFTGSAVITGSLNMTGSILPEGDGLHDLGGPSNFWRTASIEHIVTLGDTIEFRDPANKNSNRGTLKLDAQGGLKVRGSNNVLVPMSASHGMFSGKLKVESNLDVLGNTNLEGTLAIQGISNVSSSIAAAAASGGDSSNRLASEDTGSLLTTASVSSNTITFTKGDASTFNVTVDTGSGGGGGGLTTSSLGLNTNTDPDHILGWSVEYRQVWDLGAANGFGVNNALGTGHPTGLWFKPDGTKAYATSRSPRTLYQVDLDTAWDLTSVNLSTEIEKSINGSTGLDGGVGPSTPYNLYVKPDGKSFFIIDYNQRDLVEYTCSVAWDLSTYDTAAVRHIRAFEDLNTDGSDFYPRGIYFKPDGTKLFVTNGQASSKDPDIITFDLSTAWDVTTATQNTSQSLINNFTINPYSEDPADTGSINYIPSDPPNTIAFNASGSIMYTAGNSETLQQYTLSTPWDISTARIKEAYSVDRLNGIIEQNQNNTLGESYTDPSALYVNAEAGYAYMLFHGGDEVIRFTMGNTIIENNVNFDKNLYVNGHIRAEGGLHLEGGILIQGGVKMGQFYGGQANIGTINATNLYANNQRFEAKNPLGTYSFRSADTQYTHITSSATSTRYQTLPDKDGTFMLDTDTHYIGRYDINAQTYVENSGSLEFYYTARADGQGEYNQAKGAVATSGQSLNRRIFYSDRAFAHPDSSSHWTEYNNGGDISLTVAKNRALDLLNFRDTGSIPLSFKSSIENHLTDSLYNTSSMGLAYGLRRLNHTHDGYAIQVENDSNVTLDIGFDNDGNLDTGSILTHIGSGEGYVTKWYDQSPNQNDAYYDSSYTYAGDKPKIATAGAIITDNGKPAIDTSVGGAFVMTEEYSTGTSDFLMTVVANKTSTNSNQGMIIGTQVGNDNRFWLVTSYVNFQINAGSSNHFWASPNNVNIYTLGQQLYTVNHNGSTTTIDRNGVASTNTQNRTGPFRATLLFNAWNNVNYEFKGKIQELIIFEQSSSKADVVSNINGYYGVY